MRFVNVTRKVVFTTLSGRLAPGQTSSDGGARRRRLQEALEEVVSACGDRLGVRLNQREAELVSRLMDLDERGGGFRRDSLPKEYVEDPSCEKEADRDAEALVRRRSEAADAANAERRRLEEATSIKGWDRAGTGARKEDAGEKVDPSKLKGGFEAILEENARIAASGQRRVDVASVVDPIAAHAKAAPAKSDAPNKWDAAAADVAQKLAAFGPPDAPAGAPAQKQPPAEPKKSRKAKKPGKGDGGAA